MPDNDCPNFHNSKYGHASNSDPAFVWREDVLLPAPRIEEPRDGTAICLATVTGQQAAILKWTPVPNADTYLLQWSNNPQLESSDVREKFLPGIFQYQLKRDIDIRMGETIYWRVMAVDTNQGGGVSAMSETRSVTYDCFTDEIDNPGQEDRSKDFDINAELKGSPFIGCCDAGTYYLYLSYACEDQFENVILEVEQIDWTVDKDPDGGNGDINVLVDAGEEDYRVIVQTCVEETQNAKLNAKITFRDKIEDETFEKTVSLDILVDCAEREISTAYDTECKGSMVMGEEWEKGEREGDVYAGGTKIENCGNIVSQPGDVTTCAKMYSVVYKIPEDQCCGIKTKCCDCVPQKIRACIEVPTFDPNDDPNNKIKVCFDLENPSDEPDQTDGEPVWQSSEITICEYGLGIINPTLTCLQTGQWQFQAEIFDCSNSSFAGIGQGPGGGNFIADSRTFDLTDNINGAQTIKLNFDSTNNIYGPASVEVNQYSAGTNSNSRIDIFYDQILDEIVYDLTQTDPAGGLPLSSNGSTAYLTSGTDLSFTEPGDGQDVTMSLQEDPDDSEDGNPGVISINEQFAMCGDPFQGQTNISNVPGGTITFNLEVCSSCPTTDPTTGEQEKVELEGDIAIALGCGLEIDDQGRLGVKENLDECCVCPQDSLYLLVGMCNCEPVEIPLGGSASMDGACLYPNGDGGPSVSASWTCFETSDTTYTIILEINGTQEIIDVTCPGTGLDVDFHTKIQGSSTGSDDCCQLIPVTVSSEVKSETEYCLLGHCQETTLYAAISCSDQDNPFDCWQDPYTPGETSGEDSGIRQAVGCLEWNFTGSSSDAMTNDCCECQDGSNVSVSAKAYMKNVGGSGCMYGSGYLDFTVTCGAYTYSEVQVPIALPGTPCNEDAAGCTVIPLFEGSGGEYCVDDQGNPAGYVYLHICARADGIKTDEEAIEKELFEEVSLIRVDECKLPDTLNVKGTTLIKKANDPNANDGEGSFCEYEDGWPVLICDPGQKGFLCPGDVVSGRTSDACVYDLIGEYGLTRIAVTEDEIPGGASGSGKITVGGCEVTVNVTNKGEEAIPAGYAFTAVYECGFWKADDICCGGGGGSCCDPECQYGDLYVCDFNGGFAALPKQLDLSVGGGAGCCDNFTINIAAVATGVSGGGNSGDGSCCVGDGTVSTSSEPTVPGDEVLPPDTTVYGDDWGVITCTFSAEDPIPRDQGDTLSSLNTADPSWSTGSDTAKIEMVGQKYIPTQTGGYLRSVNAYIPDVGPDLFYRIVTTTYTPDGLPIYNAGKKFNPDVTGWHEMPSGAALMQQNRVFGAYLLREDDSDISTQLYFYYRESVVDTIYANGTADAVSYSTTALDLGTPRPKRYIISPKQNRIRIDKEAVGQRPTTTREVTDVLLVDGSFCSVGPVPGTYTLVDGTDFNTGNVGSGLSIELVVTVDTVTAINIVAGGEDYTSSEPFEITAAELSAACGGTWDRRLLATIHKTTSTGSVLDAVVPGTKIFAGAYEMHIMEATDKGTYYEYSFIPDGTLLPSGPRDQELLTFDIPNTSTSFPYNENSFYWSIPSNEIPGFIVEGSKIVDGVETTSDTGYGLSLDIQPAIVPKESRPLFYNGNDAHIQKLTILPGDGGAGGPSTGGNTATGGTQDPIDQKEKCWQVTISAESNVCSAVDLPTFVTEVCLPCDEEVCTGIPIPEAWHDSNCCANGNLPDKIFFSNSLNPAEADYCDCSCGTSPTPQCCIWSNTDQAFICDSSKTQEQCEEAGGDWYPDGDCTLPCREIPDCKCCLTQTPTGAPTSTRNCVDMSQLPGYSEQLDCAALEALCNATDDVTFNGILHEDPFFAGCTEPDADTCDVLDSDDACITACSFADGVVCCLPDGTCKEFGPGFTAPMCEQQGGTLANAETCNDITCTPGTCCYNGYLTASAGSGVVFTLDEDTVSIDCLPQANFTLRGEATVTGIQFFQLPNAATLNQNAVNCTIDSVTFVGGNNSGVVNGCKQCSSLLGTNTYYVIVAGKLNREGCQGCSFSGCGLTGGIDGTAGPCPPDTDQECPTP